MRTIYSLIFLAAFALAGGASVAQAQTAEPRSSLAAELGWVKFRVSAGRITAVNSQFRESREKETGNPLVGVEESLKINVAARSTSVNYQLSTPEEQLLVSFEGPDALVIERRTKGSEAVVPVRFEQPREGAVCLAVGPDNAQQVWKARSFWHLMLLEPDGCRQHLLPILQSLRPDWELEATADGIEDSLLRAAEAGVRPDRSQWTELVEKLGSDSFAERSAAERELRSAGPAVVAYLRTIDLTTADAERRDRIERLLAALSSNVDDTPQRIATWLVDDPHVWTSLLQSEEPAKGSVAQTQLEKLLGRKIDFANDADADTRMKQIEALRKQLP